MSVHLIGGGWSPEGDPELTIAFLAEAAARAAGSGRMVPRIAVLIVVDDETPSVDYRVGYPASFAKVSAADPVVTLAEDGAPFPSSVLTGIDALVIGGGLTPAYLAAVAPLMEEIRLLVADGLPYLGFSAGSMIAADQAIIGGWQLGGVPVVPEETGEDLEEVTLAEGLGLIDLAVDVHAAQWGTLGRLIAAVEAGLVAGGVAIDEFTALIVEDDGVRVVGAGNVWRVLEEDGVVTVATIGS
jgi:cyanophycinase